MKYLLCLGALGIGLSTVTPSLGREAQVHAFAGKGEGFVLLQPGVAQNDALNAIDPVNLESEFEALPGAAAENSDPVGLSPIAVPNWMRKPEIATDSLAGLGIETSRLPIGACETASYRPHPILSPSAESRRLRYYARMVSAACAAGVPVALFDALIIQESRYNPEARSVMGAMGLAQLMPGTARDLGVWNSWDVSQNLRGGATYLRQQLDTFGNWALALGAYNAGPGNVRKHKGVPPFRETRNYVRTILSSVSRYQGGGQGTSAFATSPRRVVVASY